MSTTITALTGWEFPSHRALIDAICPVGKGQLDLMPDSSHDRAAAATHVLAMVGLATIPRQLDVNARGPVVLDVADLPPAAPATRRMLRTVIEPLIRIASRPSALHVTEVDPREGVIEYAISTESRTARWVRLGPPVPQRAA